MTSPSDKLSTTFVLPSGDLVVVAGSTAEEYKYNLGFLCKMASMIPETRDVLCGTPDRKETA